MFEALLLLFQPELCRLKKCILLISIIIGLFSFTQNYKNWRQEVERSSQVARTPFFIAHVIDPTVDSEFKSWTHQDWLDWYQRRENLHQKASPRRKTPLTEKGLNSVIIATPSQLLKAFENKESYDSRNNAEPTYWGDTQLPSIVFLRIHIGNRHFYRIYECPPMYIAVKFVRGMPVHLQAHKSNKKNNQNVNLSKECKQLSN